MMCMRLFLTGLIFFITLPSSFGQGNPNYKLYRSNGKELLIKNLLKN